VKTVAGSSAPATYWRIPLVPYPGLRPFVDGEAALLFGRDRQVRDVIERLRQTQFIAVIGGSGSGKSSLILAGAVPELRSFGIAAAGDFWVPLICTPGTNTSAADQARSQNTPITRLARKFASLLKPCDTEEQGQTRREAIAGLLRQEVGLATLIDRYSAELQVPEGPDPRKACFLFVIDQFEELFHPTNKAVTDARLLVERVIDHFFSPHARCFLVLTMRSEHLNDCAGFLELPDAINKSSYLVRRLDREQLRSAIVEPARRLLRMHQRNEDPAMRLPAAVDFEPEVVERLLMDLQAITADPDHLPLLQHLLARLWQAAADRVRERLDLPDLIVWADLQRAVTAKPYDASQVFDGSLNVLRASLENWAQAAYQAQPEPKRAMLDCVLRRLAYKDPNTGAYSQQRIDVDDIARVLGPGKTRDDLYALIRADFLGGVDYLFWDAESPARVMLKVSHESFIRGWAHFRQTIDRDAERFEKFVDVLGNCGEWVRGGRNDRDLLEESDLRRITDAALPAVLAEPTERAAWFRFLQFNRDGARLSLLETDVDAFLAASQKRQEDRLQQERARRSLRRWAWAWVAGLLTVPALLFWSIVQGPLMNRAAIIVKADAVAKATPIPRPPVNYPDAGSAAPALATLLAAAADLDRGRWGGNVMDRINRIVLDNFAAVPLVGQQAELINMLFGTAEPTVNGVLRALLESAVWLAPLPNAGAAFAPWPGPASIGRAEFKDQADCEVWQASSRGGDTILRAKGRLLTASNPNDPKFHRGIFVADLAEGDVELQVHAARVDTAGSCGTTGSILSIPRSIDADVAIDANLRHLMHTASSGAMAARTVTLYEIDWELTDEAGGRQVRKFRKVDLTGSVPALRIAQLAPRMDGRIPGVALLDAWRAPAGWVMSMGDVGWRIFSPQSQRLPHPLESPDLQPLPVATPGGDCSALAARLPLQPGFRLVMHQLTSSDPYCFAIERGRPPQAPGRTEHIVVAVYARPSAETLRRASFVPAPVASLQRFGRIGAEEKITWHVGSSAGPLAGWVAGWGPDNTNVDRFIAAPWSTCALWRIGVEVLAHQPGQGEAAQRLEGSEKTCRGR
jgi:hypothetical protein